MNVLLADKRAEVRSALRLVLAHEPDVGVIAEVETGDELLEQIEASCPDLLLLEWALPGHPLPEVLSAVRQRCPHMQVIALSCHPEVHRLALEAGVDQFVSKADSPERLLAAIRSVRRQPSQHERRRKDHVA